MDEMLWYFDLSEFSTEKNGKIIQEMRSTTTAGTRKYKGNHIS